jgi:hypothetical protein
MKIDDAIQQLQAAKAAGVTDVIAAHWTMDMCDVEEIPGRVAWADICDIVMGDTNEWSVMDENIVEMVKYAFWRLADTNRSNIVIEN